MKHAKALCLALAAFLLVLCAACDSRTLMSDLEEVLEEMDLESMLDEALSAQQDPALQQDRDLSETGPAEEARAVSALWSEAGVYTDGSGSVLTVREDGTCTYTADVVIPQNGREKTYSVTFHGTVEDGAFTFTKVTYYGMDITALAAQAGYDDASPWEEAAAELYAR